MTKSHWMKVIEFLNPTLTWRSLVAIGLVFVLGGAIVYRVADPLGYYEIESKLRVGLTEAEVIRLLGKGPAYRYERDNAPADYYVEGHARRERPINGRVLIFSISVWTCYVWFDREGRVEDFFVGGS